jgi:hypothetical protein
MDPLVFNFDKTTDHVRFRLAPKLKPGKLSIILYPLDAYMYLNHLLGIEVEGFPAQIENRNTQ